jgi:transcriptional regulator with XRE-family HTH domain
VPKERRGQHNRVSSSANPITGGITFIIADRLKAIREQKKLSQGDIERKTGPLRCYISRVKNGHTVAPIGTLEKWAHAMKVPMYALFYDGEEPPKIRTKLKEEDGWGSSVESSP